MVNSDINNAKYSVCHLQVCYLHCFGFEKWQKSFELFSCKVQKRVFRRVIRLNTIEFLQFLGELSNAPPKEDLGERCIESDLLSLSLNMLKTKACIYIQPM